MAKTPTTINTQPQMLVALALGAAGLLAGLWLHDFGSGSAGAILMAFVFWLGLSLGGMALLVINHMAGGSWGAVARRPLEAMVSALPVALLFFIPVALMIPDLYPWADAEYVAAHKLVAWKAGYLNSTWFVIRTALYALLWMLTAWVYLRGARQQDNASLAEAGRLGYRLKAHAGLYLVVFVLTMTLAATDWTMSLQPEWWSGIYGLIFMISQAITAMALTILTLVWMGRRSERIDALLTQKRIQDLGNFLMAFTMFWAYTNASQLIIQWTNNIVETNTFYVLRLYTQPWQGMAVYLLVAGFFLPFMILFSRWVKRDRLLLAVMAGWSILNQALHLYWYVAPEIGRGGTPALADVLVFLGVGGIWFAAFIRSLGSRSVVPERDPRLLAAEHHHGVAGAEVSHAH